VPWLVVWGIHAAGATEDGFFKERIEPILREHCHACHSHEAQPVKGGLMLDSLAGLLSGGDGGAVVVPGKPEDSRLIHAVRYTDPELQMPPKNRPLSAAQVAALTEWVELGVPWPGQTTETATRPSRPRGKITQEDRAWWAFQPVRQPPLPHDRSDGWARNPIDRFIHERLQREQIPPSPAAEPAAFIRRLSFDLTGLPPAPEEVAAFEADCAAESNSAPHNPHSAVERLADRLLASPRYGERWARHWLDLVRYAESDGYRVDDYRPHVWRYRDWVIQALNNDLPYDRFVQAQLAGDELWPDDPQLARVATAFLRHWIYEYNNRDARGQWQTILNDLTDVTGDVFLGLGVQCARCHDHKFDPILQRDYYRLQAFFAPLLPRQDLVVATVAEQVEHAAQLARWREAAAEILAQIEEIEAPIRARGSKAAYEKFPEDIQRLLDMPAAERTPLEQQIAELAHRQIVYEWNRLPTHMKGDEKARLEELNLQLKGFEQLKPPPLPAAFTVTDLGREAPPTLIPRKHSAGDIEPGFLTVLDDAPAPVTPLPQAPHSTGRRAALARWLTSPDNPLTARVIVNRVWQYHFGRGLVGTSSDFGTLGEKPTHPELLDWLAAQFVADGWSLKKLHRLIVTSATYRQAAESRKWEVGNGKWERPLPTSLDPENKLFGRFPTRRLDAEQIRDALFAVTGELDLTTGGPSADRAQPRRAVYTRVTRNVRDPLLDVFDAPENFSSTAQRNITTTPTQSLLLINGQFLLQRAQAFARRLVREAGEDDSARITLAYQLALGRKPSAGEHAIALDFLAQQELQIHPEPPKAAPFLSEKMPAREGRAAVLKPGSAQERFVVPATDSLPAGDFTIEAYVLLRSAPLGDTYQAIAAHGDGTGALPGWSLAVAGPRTMQPAQSLVLRVHAGPDNEDQAGGGETIASGIVLELNKPYFVAASVKVHSTAPDAVTFVIKDAANDCEPPQVIQARRAAASFRPPAGDFVLGGVPGLTGGTWNGLIDEVRLTAAALPVESLLLHGEALPERCAGWWCFESTPGTFADLSPCRNHLTPPAPPPDETLDARTQALADFCHVLLNTNEFLYTD